MVIERFWKRVVGLVLACAGSLAFAQSGTAVTPIAQLNVPRYLGHWYEIAKFPNRFQKQCASDTSAEYALLPDGKLSVLNRCRLANGEWQQALGTAYQVGDAQSARLKVRFAPDWLSFLPFVWGDYWVVDLDDGYELAAVSEPQREFLWILARSPKVDAHRYAVLLSLLAGMGLDVRRLETTAHPTH